MTQVLRLLFLYTHSTINRSICFIRPKTRLLRATILALIGLCAVAAWGQDSRSILDSRGVLDTKGRIASVRIDAVLADFLDRTPVPGVVVAYIDQGDLIALRGRGMADLQTARNMDPSTTQLLAGSLVRPMTAAALLQLSDRGDLDISADIDIYLNRFGPLPSIFPPVTPMHLLTNTSGFDSRLASTRARLATDIEPLGDYLQKRLLPRIRPPGLVSSWSDFGFGLAGLLVEEVSGEPFPTFLEKMLFEPLEMAQTTVRIPSKKSHGLAAGYRLESSGPTLVVPDYPRVIPASWLITTAKDMGVWLQTLLAGSRHESTKILEPASVELLLSEQFVNHPIVPGEGLGFVTGVRNAEVILSNGYRGNGFSALLKLVPAQGVGLFVSCNAEVDLDSTARTLLDVLMGPETDTNKTIADANEPKPGPINGIYRDLSISHSSPEKLFSLFFQNRARTGEDGSLAWRGRSFLPVGSTTFEDSTGERIGLVFTTGQQTYLVTPENVFERLRWYEWWPLHVGLWWSFAAVFLATAWTKTPLQTDRVDLSPPSSAHSRWPFHLARLSSWLYFVFIVCVAIWLSDVFATGLEELVHGASARARIMFLLPTIAFLLSVPVIASVPVAWVRGHWSKRLRWRMLWIALAMIAFVPLLRYWKVLGFQI